MMLLNYRIFDQALKEISSSKKLILTINAHSYIVAQKDQDFHKSLLHCDILLPDGISIVWAIRLLTGQRINKIAGNDLFKCEMERLDINGGKCFFLGSSETTLLKIAERASRDYPNVQVQTYSPPYKAKFTKQDNLKMLKAVNDFEPDVLFVGMTAPKQEKWAYEHFNKLKAEHICCIGAVFDFYAGSVKRPHNFWVKTGLEWFIRFVNEPKRLWKRNVVSMPLFIIDILRIKLKSDV